MNPAIEHIDISRDELQQLLDRARTALSEEDFQKLKAAVDALSYLTDLVADKKRSGICASYCCPHPRRRRAVLKKLGVDVSLPPEGSKPGIEKIYPEKKPRHGLNTADQFRGARRSKYITSR